MDLSFADKRRKVRKRKELQKYGGGCHQKIGVSSLARKYGNIFYLRGLTDNGDELNAQNLSNTTTFQPKALSVTDIFPQEKEKLKFKREPIG